MKVDNVQVAVWTAAALMSYRRFTARNSKLALAEYSFRQTDIVNQAQELCEKIVHNPRVHQWYNADHPKCNYNYLRAIDTERRLTYLGELKGDREYPEELYKYFDTVINVSDRQTMTIQELFYWVRDTYSDVD